MITREIIIQEARTWLGTRFHHQGRCKKSINNRGGCDCLGLIMGVAQTLNIPSKIVYNTQSIPLYKYDRNNYRGRPTSDILYDHLSQLMDSNDKNIALGDVILFRVQGRLQHLGFYSYNHSMIHSWLATKQVVEHPIDDYWQKNIAAVFSFKDIID